MPISSLGAIVGAMDKQIAENPDISSFERLVDENWNERKHLAEAEFDVRSEIQGLLQRGEAGEALKEARMRERACRDSLARNNSEYDAVVESWAAAVSKTAG
ncbi:MAG: hypothetical protein ABJF10_03860 [Chthoniobacter sp.]|uniref:hypothetical protein n=1 Tax=Chthoniobacter sp. TaxID=2510640 RepID=UPI0032ADF40F